MAGAKVEVLVVKSDGQGRVSLKALMEELARRGLMSVLLEGGPTLNASALKERLVDHLLFFFAPKVIGGKSAPAMIGGEGALRIQEAERVRILKIRRIGPDVLIEGALRPGE